MQFLRSVISGSRAMRVLPSIGPVAETHTVLAENSMFDFPDNTKSAIFGMGCFWGVERLFYNQKGIYSTQCKYSRLRVVQTKSILFLTSMSERGGSDIKRL